MKKIARIGWAFGLAMTLVVPSSCSARDPQPELYPNAYLRQVGEAQAKQDIAYCQALSQQYLQKNNAGVDAAGNTVAEQLVALRWARSVVRSAGMRAKVRQLVPVWVRAWDCCEV